MTEWRLNYIVVRLALISFLTTRKTLATGGSPELSLCTEELKLFANAIKERTCPGEACSSNFETTASTSFAATVS